MGYAAIDFSKKDQVARITFNRPEARNTLNYEVLSDLSKALEEVRNSPDVKALVITGSGDSFCAGADLKYIQQAMATDEALVVKFGTKVIDTLLEVSEIPIPTIALINGYTCGGGIELMMSCDMAIAAEDALIGDRHMAQNIVGQQSNWQLPRLIGIQKSKELVFTAKLITGKEAASCGLVLRAVPREKLNDEAEQLLAQIVNKSLPSLKLAKRIIERCATIPDVREAVKYIYAERSKDAASQAALKKGIAGFGKK